MRICNTCSFSRSNRWVVFLKVAVLENFEMTIVKYPCWSLFLNDTAGCRPETLSKRYSGTGASSVNFEKCFRRAILWKTCELLNLHSGPCRSCSVLPTKPGDLNSYFTMFSQPETYSKT